jgi:hypothetical protein
VLFSDAGGGARVHRHRPRALAIILLLVVVKRVGIVFLRLHVFTMQLQASHLPAHRPSCCRSSSGGGGPYANLAVTVTPPLAARVLRCLVVLGSVCEHSRQCADVLHRADPDHDPTDTGDGPASGPTTPGSTPGGKKRKRPSAAADVGMGGAGSPGGVAGPPRSTAEDEAAAETLLTDLPPISAATLHGCGYAAATFALAIGNPQVARLTMLASWLCWHLS